MAIVTPSDDILVQECGAMYSFTASSAVSGGSVVMPAGPMTVKMATPNIDNPIGVAQFEAAAGNAVTVLGPYNIVRCCASGGITWGDDLRVASTGKVHAGGPTYGGSSATIGIALDDARNNGALRVLLR